MKILLIGNYLPDKQESMLRFADLMKQELIDMGHEVKLITPKVKLRSYKWPKKLEKWMGYVDKFIFFPSDLCKAVSWADVVHICDHSNSMYVKHVASKPHLITCHDLLAVRSAKNEFPVNKVGLAGRLLQAWIGRGLKSAKYIVCVSNATMSDCKRILDVHTDRLAIIYSGLNYPYTPMPLQEANQRLNQLGISNDQKYLMNIGNNSWYKNRLTVLRIFAKLVNQYQRNIYLIFAGSELTPEMNDFINAAGISGCIKQLGSISNEDLRALYSRAEGLLFPSLEEGFGWPVLEAQACGCPVFTSNRAPMTEIGGNAAVYIDPLSPDESAKIVDQHLDHLNAVREQGLLNAKKFSNAAMRDSYLKIYSKIAGVE